MRTNEIVPPLAHVTVGSVMFGQPVALRRHVAALLRRRSFSSTSTPLRICGQTYQTDEWTNVTPKIVSLTEGKLYQVPENPIGLVTRTIQDHFSDYDILDYPSPVVTVSENFDSLLVPKDHVSRSKHDTYYVNKDLLLRCHTSAHQGHGLERGSRKFVCVADVYRRDAIDSTHFPAFHQCEVLKVMDESETGQRVMRKHTERLDHCQEDHDEAASAATMRNMKSALESYVRRLLGPGLLMRWVPAFFPFTHPSLELEIQLNGKWLEILGCGVVEHKLLTNHGVHRHIAWAAGFGLERLAMLKYAVPDIRLFWSTDSGFTTQFKGLDPWQQASYTPISVYPQCYADLSFWLPDDQFSSNDFYDLVRTVGGDWVEQVELIDEFLNKKTNRTSHCYRITYRSHERTLSQAEVNHVHDQIAKIATSELKVGVRA